MPKVELHVHVEGSIRPETVLRLADRHGIELPATDLDSLQEWYRFRDFAHFVEVYVAVSKCVRTAEDLDLVFRQFVEGQAEQHVIYTEATYTASTLEKYAGIPWPDQLAAMIAARRYARESHGIDVRFSIDIVRGDDAERAVQVAKWAVQGMESGAVCSLGLAGMEGAAPADRYADAFRVAHEAGLEIVPHAGETKGPESIREVLDHCKPPRIAHGVRCLEDAVLTRTLLEKGIVLDVTPTSNVCLGVVPSVDDHMLPRLLDAGLPVTIGSDDPPMFGTSITEEYARISTAFSLDEDILWTLMLNAANGALLPNGERAALVRRLREEFQAALEKEEEAVGGPS